jgi:hypothetical protein
MPKILGTAGCLILTNLPKHMRALAAVAQDGDVPVAEHDAAGGHTHAAP